MLLVPRKLHNYLIPHQINHTLWNVLLLLLSIGKYCTGPDWIRAWDSSWFPRFGKRHLFKVRSDCIDASFNCLRVIRSLERNLRLKFDIDNISQVPFFFCWQLLSLSLSLCYKYLVVLCFLFLQLPFVITWPVWPGSWNKLWDHNSSHLTSLYKKFNFRLDELLRNPKY